MNESPVFLLMNIRLHQAQKELPVQLFESGVCLAVRFRGAGRSGRLYIWWHAELHSVDGLPQCVFVQSKYSVEVRAACIAWPARR